MADSRDSQRPRRWLTIGFAAVVAAVAMAIALRWANRNPLARLQPGPWRIAEGRIAGLEYQPYQSNRRGARDVPYTAMNAAADLQIKLQREPKKTADDLHRLGVVELALGRVDRAVDQLSDASRQRPRDAAIRSDLAAAQLAAGNVADAAENAALALAYDPSSAPAAFNWALAMEKLSNRTAAIAAWRRYIGLDDWSGWTHEARERSERLAAGVPPAWETARQQLRPDAPAAGFDEVVRRNPQRVRVWLQDEILPRWVDKSSPADLQLMRRIADVRSRSGDPYLSALVQNAARRDPRLLDGVRHFGRARAIGRKDMSRAAAELSAAAAALESAQSPLAIPAQIYLATNEFYSGRADEALDGLNELARRKDLARFPAVAAEMLWIRGMIETTKGHLDGALQSYRGALAHARRAQETEAEVAVMQLVSALMDQVGDPAEADQLRREVVARVESLGVESNRGYNAYATAAAAELRAGRPHVALAYNSTQRAIAAKLNDPLLLAESDVYYALACRDLGRIDDASTRLAVARPNAARVSAAAMRDRIQADIHFVQASLEASRAPQRAVDELSAALAIWTRNDWHTRLAIGHLLRGRSRLTLGDRRGAERDFRDGIAEVERQRSTLAEPAMRISYLERADQLFDRLTELLLADGREAEALEIVERKRARALLENIAGEERQIDAARPLSTAELARALPAECALIEYAVLDSGTSAWIVTPQGARRTPLSLTAAAAESLAKEQADAILRNDQETTSKAGRRLYDALIAPLLPLTGAATTLVIAPDGPLHSVSFAALTSPDGRHLIESRAVAIALSGSSFVRAVQLPDQRASIVSIGVTAAVAELPPLPAASREAQQIAALYEKPLVLTGETATAGRFASAVSSADVIHFAGHALWSGRRPADAALCFTPSSESDAARLTSPQVIALPLTRSPLVVLSACGTGRGRILRTEGVDSLAGAFLHAGARGVVATMWDVDDEASEHLLTAFHQALRRGESPSAALRSAQLAMLTSPVPTDRLPSAWAAAEVIGTR